MHRTFLERPIKTQKPNFTWNLHDMISKFNIKVIKFIYWVWLQRLQGNGVLYLYYIKSLCLQIMHKLHGMSCSGILKLAFPLENTASTFPAQNPPHLNFEKQ